MNYDNANNQFLSVYQPLRRLYNYGLLQPAAAIGAGYLYNTARQQYNRFRNSLSGSGYKFASLAGTFSSQKKIINSKINSMPARRRFSTPPTPAVTYRPIAPMSRKRKGSLLENSVKKVRKTVGLPYSGKKKVVKKKKQLQTTTVLAGRLNGKGRKVRRDKFDKRGIIERIESATDVNDNNCVYIGHATMPQARALLAVARSMVKALALKIGMPVADFNDNIPVSSNSDIWTLYYRSAYDSASPVVSTNLGGFTGGSYSLANVSNTIRDFLAGSRNTQTFLIRLSFTPAPIVAGANFPYTRGDIDLVTAKFSYYCRSKLTIQNQTKNLEGTTSTETVNQVPLIGKFYEGPGNGTNHIVDNLPGTPFVADDVNGWIVKPGSATNSAFEEPPKATEFFKVRRTGGVHIGPGEMKTSVITTQKTWFLNAILRELWNESLNTYTYVTKGYYRFFGFEKALGIDQATDYPILIAFEHELLIKSMLTAFASKQTAQITANAT